jgi:hypothetical protein
MTRNFGPFLIRAVIPVTAVVAKFDLTLFV